MDSKFTYSLDSAHLVVSSRADGEEVWRGRPAHLDVLAAVALTLSEDCIVLLDWLNCEHNACRNLVRLNPSGVEAWRIGPPNPKPPLFGVDRLDDAYVGIGRVTPDVIEVDSYAGFRDLVAPETGQVLGSEFTK